MHRLLAVVDGKLLDITDVEEAVATPLLERASSVALTASTTEETVNHYPDRNRWLKGGKETAEETLPDGWTLPNGRQIPRPGGKNNPHRPAQGKQPEVRARWRLASSTPPIPASTPNQTGQP